MQINNAVPRGKTKAQGRVTAGKRERKSSLGRKKQHKTQQRLQFEEPTSNHSQFIGAPNKYPINSSQSPVFNILKKNPKLFESGKRKGILGEVRGELEGEKTLLCQLFDYNRCLIMPSPIWNLCFCDAEAKGDVCGNHACTKGSPRCVCRCAWPNVLPYSSLGIRRGLLVTSKRAKRYPSYKCKWGYFSLPFFLNMTIMTLEEWQPLLTRPYFLMIFILHSYIGIKANFLLKGVR